jgi:hypothetical protein
MTNLIFAKIIKTLESVKELQKYILKAEAAQDPEDCEEIGLCTEFLQLETQRLNVLCFAII